MEFIELNGNQHQGATSLSLNEYLEKEPKAEKLILDCRSLSFLELKKLVETVRTRFIIYAHASQEQEEILAAAGHFDMTEPFDEAEDFCAELEFMLDDWDYSQGFFAFDEAMKIAPELMNFADYVERHGRYEVELSGDFPADTLAMSSQLARNWMGLTAAYRRIHKAGKFLLSFDCETSGSLEVKQVISQSDRTGKVLARTEIKAGADTVFEHIKDAQLSVQLYLSGKGRARLGKTWIYKYKHGMGHFVLGDERRTVTATGEHVHSYYIPGKLKGKLIVGFSGALNEIPHYERQSMASLGFPVLLFLDLRERSGAFMLGRELNPAYEELVQAIIEEKLAENVLSHRDLIVTGWSMGSFPSLYYGLKMEAGDIIPAKVVANLGNVTADEFIIYRNDGSMLSARPYLTGRSSHDDSWRLNQLLPELAKASDLSETCIHGFFMSNDELDQAQAFVKSLEPELKSLEIQEFPGFHGEGRLEMGQFIVQKLEEIKENLGKQVEHE